MGYLLVFLLGALLTGGLAWLRTRYLGFAGQDAESYRATGPDFDVRRHLNGPIDCEGVIFGPTGRVTSRFVAEFDGRWDGSSGRLTERFRYSNGETQEREWRLVVSDDGRIRAHADDVVGAGDGMQAGPGVRMTYRLRLPEASGGHVLDAVDWMYLADNGTIINRSQFRKFGITVAELVATMRPRAAVEAEDAEAA